MIRALLVALVLLGAQLAAAMIAPAALAQTPPAAASLPAPISNTVSDFANLLDNAATARLVAQLDALRMDLGVEVAVVTVQRRADYGKQPDIERFATDLFNAWGIGDATRNDGILVLLAVEDREARIALGAGYPPVWDGRAQRVMDAIMVPRFAAGDYPGGLEAGLEGLEEHLIRPFKAGQSFSGTEGMPEPPRSGIGADLLAFLAFVLAAFGYVVWKGRRTVGDILSVARPCPSCGGKGVEIVRETLEEAAETSTGTRLVQRRCPSCGWHADRHESIPSLAAARKSASSSSGFGGGRSSGGGASGRW